MYFTKRLKSSVARKIQSEHYDVYAIKLKADSFADDADELAEIVDRMFSAWRKMTSCRWGGYLKNYEGIIRRLFFAEESGRFSPFFYLICVRKRNLLTAREEYLKRVEAEKLKIRAYIKWFSAWAMAVKQCANVSVGFSLVDIENMESVLNEFFTDEKYTLFALLDEAKRELLKKAAGDGKHKLTTLHGTFRKQEREVGR